MPEYNSAVLSELLQGCLQRNRRSQEQLYRLFYGYAMGICLRYTHNREEAREVMNDGFLKAFTKIETYDQARPFNAWLGRIMINTALDHYRRQVRHQEPEPIIENEKISIDESVISELSCNDIMSLIGKLSPAYRIVFSLAAIDGYSHEEIAEKLGISVGTSKSNLARAREKLKMMLSKYNTDDYARMAR